MKINEQLLNSFLFWQLSKSILQASLWIRQQNIFTILSFWKGRCKFEFCSLPSFTWLFQNISSPCKTCSDQKIKCPTQKTWISREGRRTITQSSITDDDFNLKYKEFDRAKHENDGSNCRSRKTQMVDECKSSGSETTRIERLELEFHIQSISRLKCKVLIPQWMIKLQRLQWTKVTIIILTDCEAWEMEVPTSYQSRNSEDISRIFQWNERQPHQCSAK